MDYVTLVYPSYQRIEITGTELTAITPTPSDLVSMEREETLPLDRRRSVRTYNQLRREASFAARVLSVYGNRCAICGVQLRLLDAAHIVPVGLPGSTDETKNGIALCPTHHRSFDRGLIGITPEYRIELNGPKLAEMRRLGLIDGLEEFKTWSRVGDRIHLPDLATLRPDPEYLRRGLRTRGFPEF
jgi:putative restriction endonuclease